MQCSMDLPSQPDSDMGCRDGVGRGRSQDEDAGDGEGVEQLHAGDEREAVRQHLRRQRSALCISKHL